MDQRAGYDSRYDTLVVGAGSAGCALAGRLPGRVLVLEAGPLDLPDELRDAGSLAATDPAHPRNWAFVAELYGATAQRPARRAVVPRGRGLGGSGSINAANWVWATPGDARDWAQPGWSWPELADCFRAAETDHDHTGPGADPQAGGRDGCGTGARHGDRGPVPVRRPAGRLLHPAAPRFLAAAQKLGFPAEPDKNAGGPPGAGLVPSNAVAGVRINPAMAYLRDRAGVTVRGDAPVARVLVEDGRACGVQLLDGNRIEAGEVVLAAGAVGTAQLLLLSGIGPADQLHALGLPVHADLPVGRGWSDHPAVYLPFTDADPPVHRHAPSSQAALDLDCGGDPDGDGELLLFVRPFTDDGPLHLMCALQAPDSRGTITLDTADPRDRPRIRYHYLRTEHDRRRLRHVVRTGAELLRAGLGRRVAPAGAVLGTDRALDGWIADNLTTAVHLCGSAAMGPVLDPQLRVHGVAGLRVADTSALPAAPRRGTAATAVAIGERAARLITGAG